MTYEFWMGASLLTLVFALLMISVVADAERAELKSKQDQLNQKDQLK
ncbi:hypothetical protein PU634_05015 [Oceanimonas pelagia]|uniref:Uncharacterized protein n=1 Tax=Oceanimonas pelagia TaxID=3028314 RepID=A0AA50KQ92_9GAMM|nr:hypothetical protein [Oceanimonas pelagia]WMC11728.1 hypothetical protein PU634_05015 [Oceanimonas pelagia]